MCVRVFFHVYGFGAAGEGNLDLSICSSWLEHESEMPVTTPAALAARYPVFPFVFCLCFKFCCVAPCLNTAHKACMDIVSFHVGEALRHICVKSCAMCARPILFFILSGRRIVSAALSVRELCIFVPLRCGVKRHSVFCA